MFEGLFQPMHLLVIAVIALIVLGPRKLPELGRGLGDGIREFKKSISDMANSPSDAPKERSQQASVDTAQASADATAASAKN